MKIGGRKEKGRERGVKNNEFAAKTRVNMAFSQHWLPLTKSSQNKNTRKRQLLPEYPSCRSKWICIKKNRLSEISADK